jgi:TolB-like protein/tRNA A-37 threonylcarbamoyl transferase component Bud32/Flp pilus assembly protein TadD
MIGRTLLHYTITEQIGEGGMGIVYKARDKRLHRAVVVKTLRPDRVEDPEKKKRFVQEAQAASALNHPNIVTIHDIATVDGIEFIVMEYVHGKALDCIIHESRPDVESAVKYAIQIAGALEAAHASGIVHRDLKPGNVMVTTSQLVKLLDFGLAKLTEKPKTAMDVTTTVYDRVPSTAEGALVGTIAYMSPEQALADTLDGRSDLFSFGALLYEMVTGQRAFKGASAIATLCGVLREDPPPPSALNDRVPPALDRLIMRCLQKRPSDRYNNATEVKAELEAVLAARTAPQPAACSVAVLPFANLTGDIRLDTVCEGLPKDIAGALTRVPSLRVTVPAAAGLPVERPLHGPAIGQRLRADLVLDGNVRGSGKRIRITAELVSVADGYHLWSERYDRDASDVFAMQDEICRDIVNRIRKHLGVSKSQDGADADRCYADGRALLERFTSESLAKAKDCFEKAVTLRRDSGPIYAAIADYYISAALQCVRTAREAMEKADWAARKALSIDGNSERAHVCLGIVHGLNGHNWEEAAQSFARAIAINPGSPSVRQAHALWHLAPLGRVPEALDDMLRSLHAEAASPRRLASLAWLRYLHRDLDESVRLCRTALEADPRCWLAHWVLGWAQLAARQNESALRHARAALEEERLSGWTKALYAAATFAAGDPEPARAALAEMDADTEGRFHSWAALVRVATGDIDRAFRSAAKAVQERDPMCAPVIRHPLFDPYRADSRYNTIARRLHIAQRPAVADALGS